MLQRCGWDTAALRRFLNLDVSPAGHVLGSDLGASWWAYGTGADGATIFGGPGAGATFAFSPVDPPVTIATSGTSVWLSASAGR